MLNTTKLHIERLLLERGIVAVPGLGMFVSRRVAASLEGDKISAPDVVFGFENYALGTSDDELSLSITRALGCDRDHANDIIAHDVEMIRRELNIEGHSDLGSYGSLAASATGATFESDTAGSWLQTFDIAPLQSVVAAQQTENEAERRREVFLRSLRRAASSAAAIATFGIMAGV